MESKYKLRIKVPSRPAEGAVDENYAIRSLNNDKLQFLQAYLSDRIRDGVNERNLRLPRMMKIDRIISTWRHHTSEDTKRLHEEETTGRQTAVAGNLPLLASHLDDITAFYADTLAPQSAPFISNSANQEAQNLIKRLSRDVQSRGYYRQVVAAARSLVKYNLGGVVVTWDSGKPSASAFHGIHGAGNSYRALPIHNTFWDPAIPDPADVTTKAEWAAYTEVTNRASLVRRAATGTLIGIDRFIDRGNKDRNLYQSGQPHYVWVDPARAVPTEDGTDSMNDVTREFPWGEFNLGISSDTKVTGESQFELTSIYCWIVPEQHGLLSADEKVQLKEKGIEPSSFVELWHFELIDNYYIISGKRHVPLTRSLNNDKPVIPMFLSHLIIDELGNSQRSQMELLASFQRLSSSIFEIAINALRADVWGTKFVDPSVIDTTQLETNPAYGTFKTKKPGYPVGNAVSMQAGSNGASQAFTYVGTVLDLKNNLYPSQALPSQVAGLERAVTSQVSAIVHGAQRGVKMSLRQVDDMVFAPARIESARNLARYESLMAAELDDETIAKELGSGIESLESDRITEALWRLMMAIIQSQEAMQTFDVSRIMAYLAQILRVNEDFSLFVRQPQQPQEAPQGPNQQPQPPAQADEDIVAQAQQAGII